VNLRIALVRLGGRAPCRCDRRRVGLLSDGADRRCSAGWPPVAVRSLAAGAAVDHERRRGSLRDPALRALFAAPIGFRAKIGARLAANRVERPALFATGVGYSTLLGGQNFLRLTGATLAFVSVPRADPIATLSIAARLGGIVPAPAVLVLSRAASAPADGFGVGPPTAACRGPRSNAPISSVHHVGGRDGDRACRGPLGVACVAEGRRARQRGG